MLFFSDGKTSPTIYLSGNPFICDCKLGWIQSINNGMEVSKFAGRYSHLGSQTTRRHLAVGDLDELTCTLPKSGDNSMVIPSQVPSSSYLVQNIPQDQFLCPYKTHCFDLCR